MSKILGLGILIFGLTGCVTGSKMNEIEKAAEKRSWQYRRGVKSKTFKTLKSKVSCKKLAKWDWKKAVDVANQCFREKRLTMVERIGNRLAKRETSAPWGPYYLGLVALERKEIARAQWMAELSLKRAPEQGVLHYLKGQVHFAKKEMPEAVESFEKALGLDKAVWPANIFLGQIYFRSQDYGKAADFFQAAIRKDFKNPVALVGLAETQLQNRNVDGALEIYGRLSSYYKNDGQYLQRKAEIYETAKSDFRRALDTYKKLRSRSVSGKITKNRMATVSKKIRELTKMVAPQRSIASTDEKKKGAAN